MSNLTTICTSFWGFEQPTSLPPNFVLTGPMLTEDEATFQSQLREKNERLALWLDDALDKDETVMYVALGSEVVWLQWYVDVMYEGCQMLKSKGHKLRVIWAIKNGNATLPLDHDKDKHWASNWLPQIEVLAHPAVKVGVSHVGFGGTCEFINAGIPVMTFPHFTDQCMNAKQLVESGAAIELIPFYRAWRDFMPDSMYHKEPLFTAGTFASKLETLLTDKSYTWNTLRLKASCRAQGGASLAVRTIESVYVQSLFAVKVDG